MNALLSQRHISHFPEKYQNHDTNDLEQSFIREGYTCTIINHKNIPDAHRKHLQAIF